jgi:hypothetical protein
MRWRKSNRELHLTRQRGYNETYRAKKRETHE